jgi:hypothetical protein
MLADQELLDNHDFNALAARQATEVAIAQFTQNGAIALTARHAVLAVHP